MPKKEQYVTGFQKYITDEEFKLVWEYVMNIKNMPVKMAFCTIIFLGLRGCECVNLTRGNFNKDFTRLTYALAKRKKPPFTHTKQVPEFFAEALKEEFLGYPDHRMLFPISLATLRDRMRLMRKKMGLSDVYHVAYRKDRNPIKFERISLHTLRHYYARKMYEASGNDLKAVQQLIGHKKAETTAEYIRAITTKEREKEIINKAWS